MWNFWSGITAGVIASKNASAKSSTSNAECSDDEGSCASNEEVLECPICWESFNIVENVPYVLWCGHTLCKNCVLGLQWAVFKFPNVPIRLPLCISCPWCNLFSLRLVYKSNLIFPRKNYFLLWMVESMNGDRQKSQSLIPREHQPVCPSSGNLLWGNHSYRQQSTHVSPLSHSEHSNSNQVHNHLIGSYFSTERICASLRKSLALFMQLTAKFPLVIIFLLIVVYAIPASVGILTLYILITILFALPSFLVLYFTYPTLNWLLREIFA